MTEGTIIVKNQMTEETITVKKPPPLPRIQPNMLPHMEAYDLFKRAFQLCEGDSGAAALLLKHAYIMASAHDGLCGAVYDQARDVPDGTYRVATQVIFAS